MKPTPERDELCRQRDELLGLESRLRESELKLAVIRADLARFQDQCMERIGPFVGMAKFPGATDGRAQGGGSDQVVGDSSAVSSAVSLKGLYRMAARLIHPDRAADESERGRLTALMAAVNLAYEQGDHNAIAQLIRASTPSNALSNDEDVGAALVTVIRQIARVRSRIEVVDVQLAEVMRSPAFLFMERVRAEECLGRNPLREIERHLQDLATPTRKQPVEARLRDGDDLPDESRVQRAATPWSASKSRVADCLRAAGLEFRCDFPLVGQRVPGIQRPDFSFVDPQGRCIVWEHLDESGDPAASERWERKRIWLEGNGFISGINLFVTSDKANGSIDMAQISTVMEYVKALVLPGSPTIAQN